MEGGGERSKGLWFLSCIIYVVLCAVITEQFMSGNMKVVSTKAAADLVNHRNGIYAVNQLSDSYNETASLFTQLVLFRCVLFSPKFTQRVHVYVFSSSSVNIWTHA